MGQSAEPMEQGGAGAGGVPPEWPGSGRVPLDELVQRARRGQQEALSLLLSRLRPRLARFGARLCGQAGEDALQEALLTLSTRIGEFRGESDIYSWAYALVRSACSRQTRGLENASKEPISPELLERRTGGGEVLGPEARLVHRQRSEEINCALAALDGGMRAAVVLRDVEELSARDAAEILGISVPALKSRLHRGRKALAQALSDPERDLTGCPDVISAFSRDHEGELSPGGCAELRRHLQDCPDCLRRCQQLRDIVVEARQVPVGPE